MNGLRAAFDGVGDEAPVESGELPGMGLGEGEQIAIGDLAGGEQAGRIEPLTIKDADVVRPEAMARKADEFGEEFGYSRRISGKVRVASIS